MKTKKAKMLQMAVKLVKATKGKNDTAMVLKQVYEAMAGINPHNPQG